MAESSPSFQDIFKLMNSMTSFETLLDATDLKPEECIKLGIHEQFKKLHEKLGKYVHDEETRDLNFKCVCNLCYDEIKILNYDLKTSLAIHNASELHRIVAKNKEMHEQNQDSKSGHEKESLLQPINLNNIPSELKKNEKLMTYDKEFLNNLNDAIPLPCPCLQEVCICGDKDKNLPHLNEKLSNLNVSQQAGMQLPMCPPFFQQAWTQQPMRPPMFPAGLQAQGFGQQYIPRGRNPSPQGRPNKKPQEKRNVNKTTPVGTVPAKQAINIHVHMPPSAERPPAAAVKPSTPQHHNKNKQNIIEANLEKLRTKDLGYQEEMQLMYKMIREAEGKYFKRKNYTKIGTGNEFLCNVCNTGSRITSAFDLVKHARGRSHQETLQPPAMTNVPQNRNQSKNAQGHSSTWEKVSKNIHQNHGFLNGPNMELLRNRVLDDRTSSSLMWKMVKEAEGAFWKRDNITAYGDIYRCNICGVDLNSQHQLVQHVQGLSHSQRLGDNNNEEPCVIM